MLLSSVLPCCLFRQQRGPLKPSQITCTLGHRLRLPGRLWRSVARALHKLLEIEPPKCNDDIALVALAVSHRCSLLLVAQFPGVWFVVAPPLLLFAVRTFRARWSYVGTSVNISNRFTPRLWLLGAACVALVASPAELDVSCER